LFSSSSALAAPYVSRLHSQLVPPLASSHTQTPHIKLPPYVQEGDLISWRTRLVEKKPAYRLACLVLQLFAFAAA
jgi:hypothetical protein